MPSALLIWEIAGLLLCAICLAIAGRTLNDALATYRQFRRAREVGITAANDPGVIWALIQVRGRACLLALECLSLAWGIDRMAILLGGDPIGEPRRFLIYGLLRTSMSLLAAGVAVANMLAYRKLK